MALSGKAAIEARVLVGKYSNIGRHCVINLRGERESESIDLKNFMCKRDRSMWVRSGVNVWVICNG